MPGRWRLSGVRYQVGLARTALCLEPRVEAPTAIASPSRRFGLTFAILGNSFQEPHRNVMILFAADLHSLSEYYFDDLDSGLMSGTRLAYL